MVSGLEVTIMRTEGKEKSQTAASSACFFDPGELELCYLYKFFEI